MAAADADRDASAIAEDQSAASSGEAASSGDPPRDIASGAEPRGAPTLRSRIAELKKEQALAKARNKELKRN